MKADVVKALKQSLGRKNLQGFVTYTYPEYEWTQFHVNFCRVLDMFAQGKIKKLIISAPPQHGKSELATRRIVAFLLGQDPNKKIAVASYASTLARKFNRDIQRILDEPSYTELFPETQINAKNVVTTSNFLRNSDEFEVINKKGGLKVVGRGAGITGFSVDVSVLDDLYKDASEGNSPVIRESAWEWYCSVWRTRQHNTSQELITFTRWHEDDLIGRIEKTEQVIELERWAQLEDVPKNAWIKINFEAIKKSEPTEIDPRAIGSALFPSKHSLEKLLSSKQLDEEGFECMSQGNPLSRKGLLYRTFATYDQLPNKKYERKCYTDTADKGKDWLCSIVYDVGVDDNFYIVDMVYSDEPFENTEKWVAEMINRNKVVQVDIESNNGGRGFARAIEANTSCLVNAFHQSKNKESRILTNSSAVNSRIIFPSDWSQRWPIFYEHLTKFKKSFSANAQDDVADTLTGIIEKNETQVSINW